MKHLSSVLVDNMAILVVLIGVIGAVWPSTLTWVGPHIPWMLGIVMLGMGMTLSVDDFRNVFRRPQLVLIGIFAQFFIMPLVAWALVRIFALPPEIAIGVILVGTCPGGTASNVISYLARGDVALSVSMSMATTILAPVVTPALTWLLAGAWIEVSFTAMMISIAEMVLLPLLLGLCLNHFCRCAVSHVLPYMPLLSVTAIVLLVGGVVALSASKLMDVGLLLFAIVVLHNGFGLFFGYVMAHLSIWIVRKPVPLLLKSGCKIPGWQRLLPCYISIPLRQFPELYSVCGITCLVPFWPTSLPVAMNGVQRPYGRRH